MLKPTLRDWIAKATEALAGVSDVPALEARVLARMVLGMNETELITRSSEELASDKIQRLEAVLARRMAHEPMAYILGQKEFADFSVAVDSRVLIPRPETEAILEYAIGVAAKNKIATIYEIGTGSGVLAIGLARALPGTKIIASDISAEALEVARRNIAAAGVSDRIELVQADLASHAGSPVELIVANLPYLPLGLPVAPELGFEPAIALWSGTDGLEHYKRLLSHDSGRQLILELGASQYELLLNWLKGTKPAWQIEPIVSAGQIIGAHIKAD